MRNHKSHVPQTLPRTLDDPHLQPAFTRLQTACVLAGVSLEELFREPLAGIVAFAILHGIRLQDLIGICRLMVQRLDELYAQLGRTPRRCTRLYLSRMTRDWRIRNGDLRPFESGFHYFKIHVRRVRCKGPHRRRQHRPPLGTH